MKKERRNRPVVDRSYDTAGQALPTPPDAPRDAIWARVEALISSEQAESKSAEATQEAPKSRKRGAARRRSRRRRLVRVLDIVAVAFWSFSIIKLFIADIDRFIVSAIAPGASWLLDFRLVLVMLLVAALMLLLKARTLAAAIAYVSAYPLILLGWKLPKLIFKNPETFKRRGMWMAVALANSVAVAVTRGKRIVLAVVIYVACAVVILFSDWAPGLYISIAVLLATVIWAFIARTIDMFRSSAFIRAQQGAIGWLLKQKFLADFLTPKTPNKISIKDWSIDDAKGYRDTAGNALLIHHLLSFWAFGIDKYRRGPALTIINIGAVLGLGVQLVAAFSLANAGLYAAAPGHFETSGSPGALDWIYYTSAGIALGEIESIKAAGNVALLVKLLSAGFCGVGLMTIFVTFVVVYRTQRSDGVAQSAVEMLREKTEHIEELSLEQYKTDIPSLEEHLVRTAWGLQMITRWLYSRIPESWERDGSS